jgi:hypothetical protein
LDLVASELKGYRWEIERFLDAASRSIADLGFGQDEIVKLTFLLNDNYQKEITSIAENDAKFVADNQNRLSKTLTALHTFLVAACLAEYYATGNRSAIPLYFVCYHIFHSQRTDDQIEKMFDQFDTKSSDFSEIQSWLYWSLLNGAFRGRGAGWTPSTVGTRKILEVMKGHRGKPFPTLELFEVYKKHPLRFFETEIKREYLDRFDKAFVFYLMYERRRPVRIQDEDHIHPRHLLEGRGVAPVQINSVANLQLLDVGTNRGAKQGKEFADFLAEQVDGRNTYLGRHHIPDEQPLWRADNFAQFLEERAKLLVRQLSSICPAASTNN